MAYAVQTRKGFEIRESRTTAKGPRSRTLVTFKELNDEVIVKARERAERPLEPDQLREAAIRVGAPVAQEPVDRAAREVLRLLADGARPDPMLRRLLLDALATEGRRAGEPSDATPAISDAARAATQWIGASLERRGEALVDLLGLADAFPLDIRSEFIAFPRLDST